MLDVLVHLVIVVAFPPLLPGIIAKVKGVMGGRVGPPILQPYFDLFRLMRKGTVLSQSTTWMFLAGPVVGISTCMIASVLLPLGHHDAPVSFSGDLVLFVYLLALGRFVLSLSSLDTGSAFEGMGVAREVTYACLAEPALIAGLMVCAKLSGSIRLADMLGGHLPTDWRMGIAPLALVGVSWFIVLLAENCRIPFDDPNTHLELTMIHEVMVLDHGGPALGLILYGASMKMFLFVAVLVRLAVPWNTGVAAIEWIIFLLASMTIAVVIGLVESSMARLRLLRVPVLLVVACIMSAFGLILVSSPL
ncbi:MAG: NADH-quinone oxidoreductase subunit H [Planctomycetota bacterium]